MKNDESKWYILKRNGSVVHGSELPERPVDARPVEDGDVSTPWYKESEHIHITDAKIDGIHARGTLENVRLALIEALAHEPELLVKFGAQDDILLSDARAFLNIHS